MTTSSAGKRNRFKQALRVIVLLLIVAIVVLAVWQLNEYRKLRTALLPEGSVYQVTENLPPIAQEAVLQNRAFYLSRPTAQQLAEWEAQVNIQGLTSVEDGELATEALAFRNAQLKQPEWITYDETDVELDFLLQYMRYSFALYAYRGGDDVFIPLFDTIKEEILASGSDNRIRTDTYIDILRTNILPAVGDIHTYIGSMNYDEMFPEKRYYSYTNDLYFFEKDTNGFFCNMDNVTYRLQSNNGQLPEQYLKPGILENGTIAYILWLYTNDTDSDIISCPLSLRDESGQIVEKDMPLAKVLDHLSDKETIYSLTETEDYFYLRNSSLMSIARNMDSLNQMVADAAKIRGEKPVIIDLRGHNGGNDYYALFWLLKFKNLSKVQGLFIPMPGVSYDLKTQTIETLWNGKIAGSVARPGLVSRYKNGGNPLHMQNDTPIFVIIDRGCGSSGEWFTSHLSRLDNIVIVGENTKGMTIGGNQCTVILPVSRYKATFSVGVSVNSDLRDLEGYGLSPDIYAPPGEALERVIAMIRNYDIKGVQ